MNEHKEASKHTVVWNAVNLSSGIYIYKLEVDSKALVKKMTLVK